MIYPAGVAQDRPSLVVASAAEDCTVKLWDAANFDLKHTFRGHTAAIRSLAFSRDGRRLVSGSQDRTVKVWDLTRLKLNRILP